MKVVLMNLENKTPILIIAPFFAPQTHAAMFRVHKLVKYLPQYGYKPIVITTDINYNYNEDLKLLDEFDDCVEIHRVKYLEPTIRGVRMALGGKDRTFKAMKHKLKFNKFNSNENIIEKKDNFLRKFKSNLQDFFLTIPDAYWTWINSATKKANELIKDQKIILLYTTTNPDSVLEIGLNIKKSNSNIKWISDFRDPIGYSERYNTHHKFIDKKIKKIKNESMKLADMITGLSSSYGKIFNDLYDLSPNKYKFIPTGVDDEYISNIKKHHNTDKYIIFVGEFQEMYNNYIFEVLSNLIKIYNVKFKMKIIGRKEINYIRINDIIHEFDNLENIIEYVDHIPQTVLYKEIKNAHSCIFAYGW